jgi:hypothetical protein
MIMVHVLDDYDYGWIIMDLMIIQDSEMMRRFRV